MQYILEIQNRFHLRRCQGSSDIGLRDEEELRRVLTVFELSQLIGGVDRFLERVVRGFGSRSRRGSGSLYSCSRNGNEGGDLLATAALCAVSSIQITDMDSDKGLVLIKVKR